MNKYRILIVDDDPSMMRLIKARLAKVDGYNVFAAASGEEAIELALDKRPDLIILDWVMPGLSGLDVLKVLRNSAKLENTVYIMVTARNLVGEFEQALGLGASDYLVKPIKLNMLSDKVKLLLKQRDKDLANQAGWFKKILDLV